jgi:glycosyltransferase involved in cell wall biosynthesis
MNNHFKIIVPMYNVGDWIANNINSIKKQKYENFQCILIDDISTDNTVEIVKELIADDDRFKLYINEEKKFALKNIYEGVLHSNPDDQDIIVTVDGDDWLYHDMVLNVLNYVYEEEKCYITYGEYVKLNDLVRGAVIPNGSHDFPEHIVENNLFRKYRWISSHLRTFKYGLWKRIKKEDLLDQEGNFYKMAWDVAFMMPMLEMAGHRNKFIPDILYVYNNHNPINDYKVDSSLQLELDRQIRLKPSYSLIDEI